MREWIPVSSSPKGRLALAAVAQFGAHPFEQVTVGELAEQADVTTGALYHHFGSKLGLYAFVRRDVERRLLDRIEGAVAAAPDPQDVSAVVSTALRVGFDFAVREGFLHLLGTRSAASEVDELAGVLGQIAGSASPVLGTVLAAAWRAAVMAVADGMDPDEARTALLALRLAV